MLKSLLIGLTLYLSFNVYAQKASAWILAKQENGIIVYTRTIANSNYKEFKAKVKIKAQLSDLLNFIKKPEYCPEWQYKCIYQLQISDQYIYKLSNLPWPLKDRYTIMKSTESFDAKANIHTIILKNIRRDLLPKAIKNQLPKEGNTLQMHTSDGYWKFDLNQAPLIHITHQMHGDPAGIIPASLANLGVINAAFVSLNNLKKQFEMVQK